MVVTGLLGSVGSEVSGGGGGSLGSVVGGAVVSGGTVGVGADPEGSVTGVDASVEGCVVIDELKVPSFFASWQPVRVMIRTNDSTRQTNRKRLVYIRN